MVTQILIIHGQLPYAIKLKQSLERSAPFEVHPFTSVDSAVEYLKDHVQDVALVDFTLPDFTGEEIVRQLYETQANLTVIAIPRQDDATLQQINVPLSVDDGVSARELASVINGYFSGHERPTFSPPGTTALLSRLGREQRVAPQKPDDLPEYSSLDNVLSSADSNVFEPALSGEDTPPQPSDPAFDEVLNTLPPETPSVPPPNDQFKTLVNSMRSDDQPKPLPARHQQFVEFILSGGMDSLIDQLEQKSDPPQTPFDRLAQEEPPMPTFEESGTVSDLVSGVQDKSFRNVLSILRGEEINEEPDTPIRSFAADFEVEPNRDPPPPAPRSQFDFGEPAPLTPAQVILQHTFEQSTTGSFSLDALLDNIERQLPLHHPKVQPLPSWLREEKHRSGDDQFLVHEPDFLPEELPDNSTPVEQPSEDIYGDLTTQPARGQHIEEHPEHMETEWLENSPPSFQETIAYPDTLPEEIPAEATIAHDVTADWGEQDFNTQFEMMAAFEVMDRGEMTAGALYTEVPIDQPPPEITPVEVVPVEASALEPAPDPYIAQMALSLTEVSLELAAEATLLARNHEIVAYAGQMPAEEIDELRDAIADDWDAGTTEARIRFITAQGSGKDYMLYSRRTEDDFTLSLIFAGTMPLRDIRRQGQRLVDALLSVPEAPLVVEPEPLLVKAALPVVDAGMMTPYAWVWLMRDPKSRLDQAVSQAIVAGLNIQLREQRWQICNLQAHEDYVYLLAEIPGEQPGYQIVRDLKRRSAEIAHAQNPAYAPESLWSDSYLVVTPGRELDIEEIQQFINFERMG